MDKGKGDCLGSRGLEEVGSRYRDKVSQRLDVSIQHVRVRGALEMKRSRSSHGRKETGRGWG